MKRILYRSFDITDSYPHNHILKTIAPKRYWMLMRVFDRLRIGEIS